MLIKFKEIEKSMMALQEFSQLAGFGAKVSYNISRTVDSCEEELKIFQELKLKKAEELADKDESGKPISEKITTDDGKPATTFKMSDEARAEWSKFYDEYMNQELEIYCTPIRVSEIEKVPNIRPAVLKSLKWLVVADDTILSVADIEAQIAKLQEQKTKLLKDTAANDTKEVSK